MIAPRRCWMRWAEFLVALIYFCVVAVSGCSKPKSEGIGCFPDAPPRQADEAVRKVLAELQQQKLEELWDFLPIDYRDEVQRLVPEFVDRLDEKSWGPFVATCKKARTVVSKIVRDLDESDQQHSDSDKELASQLRAVERLLSVLCDSELRSLPTMGSLRVESFLTGTGNSLLAALSQGALGDAGNLRTSFEQFGEVKVALVESAQDSAVISVQWPGQEPTQHKFVRMRGSHWFPQTLAEAWPTEFPKVREQILAWADELRANPEPWHARLRQIDQLLDELAATKSLAEARQAGQSGLSRLVVSWLGLTVPDWPKAEDLPVETPAPAKPVRVKKPDTEVLLPDEPEK